jgi:hypothetical protein
MPSAVSDVPVGQWPIDATDGSRWTNQPGPIAKWFVRLIALVVALVVLVIAGLAANALADVVRGATAGAQLGNANMLASLARAAVWVFGIVVAVNQLGVATTLINTLFMGFVAALALALGLAFGLGGRDTAAKIVQDWYQRGQQAAPQLRDTAASLPQQAAERAGNGGSRYEAGRQP